MQQYVITTYIIQYYKYYYVIHDVNIKILHEGATFIQEIIVWLQHNNIICESI